MEPGQLLFSARDKAHHTQESLALAIREKFPRARTSRYVICQWERSKEWRPRRQTWNKLRAVLDLPPYGVLGG